MTIKMITILAAIGCLTACAESTVVSEDFGNSTRAMIKAQTLNQETLTNPSTEPVTGVDPDYANNVIKAMRESPGKPEEVKKPLQINLSGEGGR
jgi:hypothetical protein